MPGMGQIGHLSAEKYELKPINSRVIVKLSGYLLFLTT
ncbi:hypothetical protein FORC066_1489 [Yersinia enterocolitica]|nr:hypothetical protein FORC066_1489 [Yersinia enterocolitica]